MAGDQASTQRPHPLEPVELELVDRVLAALAAVDTAAAQATRGAIAQQVESLALFGELLARYPSPLGEQCLGDKRRSLGTLVDALVETDPASFPFRAPTQALVGRAMHMAHINFLRLLWHVTGSLPAAAAAGALRELAARRLRANVHGRLVEEVLADIVTDASVERHVRAQAVHSLAHLWANRLTWRVHDFFPILAKTWEARQRVRVIGGTLLGFSEMLQLLTAGADEEFVALFARYAPGGEEEQTFREFLFGTSSEELDRLAQRMARDGLSSIEIDSRLDAAGRDAGSLLFEFFRTRLMRCTARRIGDLPGPRRTAEGYVMLAWLAHQ
jgi:hypothetical protein